jgi:glycosyltransferase DesVII/glycosyltransferase OleGII
MAAINEGLPVVIVPFAWDHPETGFRIQESGSGVLLPPQSLTPASLRDAVLRVLNEPAFRENAVRLANGFHKLGGAARAAELIEQMTARETGASEGKGAISGAAGTR